MTSAVLYWHPAHLSMSSVPPVAMTFSLLGDLLTFALKPDLLAMSLEDDLLTMEVK